MKLQFVIYLPYFDDLFLYYYFFYKICMTQQILVEDEIGRIIIRISNETLERNPDLLTLIVIGIKNRGDILAKKLPKK